MSKEKVCIIQKPPKLSHTSAKTANGHFFTFLCKAWVNHSHADSWWVITNYTDFVCMSVTDGGMVADQLSPCYRKTRCRSLTGKTTSPLDHRRQNKNKRARREKANLAVVESNTNVFSEYRATCWLVLNRAVIFWSCAFLIFSVTAA